MDNLTVAVLGGAGAMGRIAVRDLFQTSPFEIVVADYHADRAREVASSYAWCRVREAGVDVTDVGATARLLEGCFAVVNAVQYQLNLHVMEAALAAGAHYVDLGGLYHMTLQQLDWHRRFEERGLLALLGMGGAPGTTNLLAVKAAQGIQELREIHIRLAALDSESEGLDASYSIQTILEEAARPTAVWTDGRLTFVDPLTPGGEVEFPPPIGVRNPTLTLHSEVATLPASLGLQECTFGIDFGRGLTSSLRLLKEVGINSFEPVRVGPAEVVPHEVLLAVLRRTVRSGPATPPRESFEVLRAIARGVADGQPVERVADCRVTGRPEWDMGLDMDTGCPPSIAVQMLARGDLTARGALPPERAVPLEPYFAELERRGMRVT
ncbi:MAG: saccharopine dehydrogenase NADP-binding domain-containing protein [Candidatus Eremiobacterota bacterium]